MTGAFDGHANCFVESGDDKALLIDFNYDTEPLPGKYPLPVVGPLSLLQETRANHLGKLAFRRDLLEPAAARASRPAPGPDVDGRQARPAPRGGLSPCPPPRSTATTSRSTTRGS